MQCKYFPPPTVNRSHFLRNILDNDNHMHAIWQSVSRVPCIQMLWINPRQYKSNIQALNYQSQNLLSICTGRASLHEMYLLQAHLHEYSRLLIYAILSFMWGSQDRNIFIISICMGVQVQYYCMLAACLWGTNTDADAAVETDTATNMR